MNGSRDSESPSLRFAVTSIIRRAGQASASGFVRVVDRGSGSVLAKAPVPESVHRADDPNPRGGLRGARGMSQLGDRLVLANTERLFVLDAEWGLEREITHPLMGGVHDILAEKDGIWVTATMSDLLLEVDWEGRMRTVWEWRRCRKLVEEFGLVRVPPVDRGIDYRNPDAARAGVRNIVHLNGVSRCPRGLLLSFGRVLSPRAYFKRTALSLAGRVARAVDLGWWPIATRNARARRTLPSGVVSGSTYVVVLLEEDGTVEILFRKQGTSVPNHNLHLAGDLLVYNDTNEGRLVGCSLSTGAEQHSCAIPGDPSFVRGLAPLGGRRYLVGSQRPAAVYDVDLASGTLVGTYDLDGHEDESVYDVEILPGDFSDPPSSFRRWHS